MTIIAHSRIDNLLRKGRLSELSLALRYLCESRLLCLFCTLLVYLLKNGYGNRLKNNLFPLVGLSDFMNSGIVSWQFVFPSF